MCVFFDGDLAWFYLSASIYNSCIDRSTILSLLMCFVVAVVVVVLSQKFHPDNGSFLVQR